MYHHIISCLGFKLSSHCIFTKASLHSCGGASKSMSSAVKSKASGWKTSSEPQGSQMRMMFPVNTSFQTLCPCNCQWSTVLSPTPSTSNCSLPTSLLPSSKKSYLTGYTGMPQGLPGLMHTHCDSHVLPS